MVLKREWADCGGWDYPVCPIATGDLPRADELSQNTQPFEQQLPTTANHCSVMKERQKRQSSGKTLDKTECRRIWERRSSPETSSIAFSIKPRAPAAIGEELDYDHLFIPQCAPLSLLPADVPYTHQRKLPVSQNKHLKIYINILANLEGSLRRNFAAPSVYSDTCKRKSAWLFFLSLPSCVFL